MNVRRWYVSAAFVFGLLSVVLAMLDLNVNSAHLLGGFASIMFALMLGFRGLRTERGRNVPGQPELLRVESVSGEATDQSIADAVESSGGSLDRRQLHKRLNSLARDALQGQEEREDLDEDVQWEDWFDDPAAASFLRDGAVPNRLSHAFLAPFRSSPLVATVDATTRRISSMVGLEEAGTRVEPLDTPERSIQGEVRTHRWTGIGAVPVATLGVGILTSIPSLVFASSVGAGYVAYSQMGSSPEISLDAERALDDERPAPDDEVTVTVTLHNTAETTVADLRVIDSVPPDLEVVSGTPRFGTVLSPDEKVVFEYQVQARRGVHEFGPLRGFARPLSETIERTVTFGPTTEIISQPTFTPSAQSFIREFTTQFAGNVRTCVGGEGLTFHSVREYRRGDPMSRIDWNRVAQGRGFRTVTYTEERAASVILALDSRPEAYISPTQATKSAHDRCVSALIELFATLHIETTRTDLLAFGPDACWTAASEMSRSHVRQTVMNHPAFARERPDGAWYYHDWMAEFRTRFTQPKHVVFFSPLCDDSSVTLVRGLRNHGYPVTVVSPDPTSTRSLGSRIERLERFFRVLTLRNSGVRVVNWSRNESLALALSGTK